MGARYVEADSLDLGDVLLVLGQEHTLTSWEETSEPMDNRPRQGNVRYAVDQDGVLFVLTPNKSFWRVDQS